MLTLNKHVTVAFLGFAAAIGLWGLVSFVRSGESLPEAATAAVDEAGSKPADQPPDSRDEPVLAAPEVPLPRQTADDYLREFHGAQWDEMRKRLSPLELATLERELDPSDLPPAWEDAKEELRKTALIDTQNLQFHADASIDWSAEFYDSWENVREVFHQVPEHATPEQLAEFREFAKPIDARVRHLAAQRTAVIADVQAYKWESGDFSRSPIICVSKPKVPGRRCVHATSCGAGNQWAMSMSIYADEMPPEYFEVGKLLGAERALREAELKAFIKTL